MNINFTKGTEKTENASQTTSSAQGGEKTSEAEQEGDKTFYDEYQKLLAQNGIYVDGINQGMFLNGVNPEFELQNGSSKFDPKTLKTDFNYDTLTISRDDALFFNDIVNRTDFALASSGDFKTQLIQMQAEDTKAQKSAEVSKSLLRMLDEAQKTQKPVRIDFDNNVSVILKVDKSGKLSASFIPADKAVEQYLRDNIGYLKQRFDEQELEYNDITYRPYKDGNNKKQKGG